MSRDPEIYPYPVRSITYLRVLLQAKVVFFEHTEQYIHFSVLNMPERAVGKKQGNIRFHNEKLYLFNHRLIIIILWRSLDSPVNYFGYFGRVIIKV